MDKYEAISRMVPPSQKRPSAWMEGIIQIWVTRACDRACNYCTQGSNLKHGPREAMFITLENYEKAVRSLKNYFGVVGMFGGNPALHPQFEELCKILVKHIPYKQRGIWCNHPLGKGKIMADTFNPIHSNLNVHGNKDAYDEFQRTWKTSLPVGLKPSTHSPVYGTPPIEEEERWEYISNCDINQHWSAMIGQFRGQTRAWFCEIAGSQAMLNQHKPDYPDTGLEVTEDWWTKPIIEYSNQINHHCLSCLVPLRAKGLLDNSMEPEKITPEVVDIYIPKKKDKKVEVVTTIEELQPKAVKLMTNYIGNSK